MPLTTGLKVSRIGLYLKLLNGTLKLLNSATAWILTQTSTMPPTQPSDSCTLPITTGTSPSSESLTIYHLQDEITEWLAIQYPNRTPMDVLIKFLEEVAELFKDPQSKDEQADLLILMLDLARLTGIDILQAGFDKMAINRSREWIIDPKTGIMSHVRH